MACLKLVLLGFSILITSKEQQILLLVACTILSSQTGEHLNSETSPYRDCSLIKKTLSLI